MIPFRRAALIGLAFGAGAVHLAVVGVLLMSEFVGAKSTVGTAQEAFTSPDGAEWVTGSL